jgi:parallel beta-helix repeat protein
MKSKTIVVIILLSIVLYSMNLNKQLVVARSRNSEDNIIAPDGLIQHSPIRIISDENLTAFNFPGLGTESHPYLIRNLNITTNERAGLYISKTTKHIIVYNCYIDALKYGIEIVNVTDGTLLITENTLKNNKYYGTFVWKTGSSNFSYNNYINNGDGLTIFYADKTFISNNTCVKNTNYGIYLSRSKSCNVTYNVLKENEHYGVVLGRYTEFCAVHHNYFINNNVGGTSQAYDHGSNNVFYDLETNEGNWWNDWFEGFYDIDGNTMAVDFYPLGEIPTEENINKTTYNLLSFLVFFPAITILYVFQKANKRTREK